MSSSAGLLEFFILEASDYVERLDGLVARAPDAGPDIAEFARTARALRGSATMAKLATFADVASGLERVASAIRESRIKWDEGLKAEVVAAIEDLKILLRAVRTWGAAEDARANRRTSELDLLVPRTGSITPSGEQGWTYLGGETADTATAVSELLARPADASSLKSLLDRVRRLRGVAALKDAPPLPEVLDGVERAVRNLELNNEPLGASQLELLSAAAELLRRTSSELKRGVAPSAATIDVTRFAAAAGAVDESGTDSERIVPVSELFYSDGGPHVVETAPNPPTTPAARFRLEAVSLAEHLRRLVGDARRAQDVATRERLGRELRAALRGLRLSAESFGEANVARFATQLAERAAALDSRDLDSLDGVASLLADSRTETSTLNARIAEITGVASTSPAPAPAPVAAPAPEPPRAAAPTAPAAPEAAPVRATTAKSTPSGAELQAMLASGIAGIERLETSPLGEPTEIAMDDIVVPIESLLYRGRAALDRAVELRDEIRTALKDSAPPPRDALDELLDLLELVGTE